MVPRRRVLVAIGFAIVALCEPSITAAQKAGGKTRPVTVTLKVDGMGWVGCAATVRSALLSVKGVTRAKVTLEDQEALVTYNPAEATVEDLIKAVNSADGGPFSYTATLKKPAAKRKP